MTETLSIHLFTVEEYHKLAEQNILHEDDRVELIEGRIVDMTPTGSRHAACVDRLTNLLLKKLEDRVIVRVQNPVSLSVNSEPQPDIAVVKYREVWLVNLLESMVEVHTEPSKEDYNVIAKRRKDQTISPVVFADISIKVSELLGS